MTIASSPQLGNSNLPLPDARAERYRNADHCRSIAVLGGQAGARLKTTNYAAYVAELRPRFDEIVALAEELYGMPSAVLLKKSRDYSICHLRQEVFAALLESGMSGSIVQRFTGYNHSTIMHAHTCVKRVPERWDRALMLARKTATADMPRLLSRNLTHAGASTSDQRAIRCYVESCLLGTRRGDSWAGLGRMLMAVPDYRRAVDNALTAVDKSALSALIDMHAKAVA